MYSEVTDLYYKGRCVFVCLIHSWAKYIVQVHATLESGIDVGQGMNVGPGKVGKKNKRRALNSHVLSNKAVGLGRKLQN